MVQDKHQLFAIRGQGQKSSVGLLQQAIPFVRRPRFILLLTYGKTDFDMG
jgi:hypothetical protein